MTCSWFCLTAFALAAIMISHAATAQTPAAPESKPAAESSASEQLSKAVDQVDKWTKKKFEAARKEWVRNKEQSADCRKQAGEQNLKGRKSWSFLYKCMTPTERSAQDSVGKQRHRHLDVVLRAAVTGRVTASVIAAPSSFAKHV